MYVQNSDCGTDCIFIRLYRIPVCPGLKIQNFVNAIFFYISIVPFKRDNSFLLPVEIFSVPFLLKDEEARQIEE